MKVGQAKLADGLDVDTKKLRKLPKILTRATGVDGGLTIKSKNTSRGKRPGRLIRSVVLDLSSLRCL